ncbi:MULTISPECIES: amidophosphoribosyltransferase [Acidianus]|uniref:Amidophosphoribosyltransferase n=1 Tax=Candidatus Acidianus copahuensis TaxID=1160895 RepID=A0A031LMY2_9CREN|nr:MULTISPECIES: amidophosphoribosyltransferase [Acidianus]EZQ04846.1 amidophosphoribosyltransferase [Candidatus Acidianus copahuensis]NON62805.1 amidophosphoribosyltransferase [Acidianus sp. RZ1]
MAGISGILAFDKVWNVNKFLKYSLIGLQHRGYNFTGVAVYNEGKIESKTYNESPEDAEVSYDGWAGIGYSGSRKGYPVKVGGIAYVVDGVLKENPEEFAKDLLKDPERALENAKGVFNLIALTENEKIIAYRDKFGLRPLFLGGFGFDLGIVSSESSGINVIGGDTKREINPGEMVVLERFNVESKQLRVERKATCSIEYIYQSRIDGILEKSQIYDVRIRIGEELAKEWPISADTVVGVPDTALPFAIGYSRKLGLRVDLGFTRTGSPIRTMIAGDNFLKVVGVQLKLNPIRSAFFGKRIVLIDDSMVTGTTLKNTVFNLRKMGAKEIHILIGSPKLVRPCPYGVEVPSESDLIAANLKDEDIAKVIGADSIHWLSIDGLFRSIGNKDLCYGCMGGIYPG